MNATVITNGQLFGATWVSLAIIRRVHNVLQCMPVYGPGSVLRKTFHDVTTTQSTLLVEHAHIQRCSVIHLLPFCFVCFTHLKDEKSTFLPLFTLSACFTNCDISKEEQCKQKQKETHLLFNSFVQTFYQDGLLCAFNVHVNTANQLNNCL